MSWFVTFVIFGACPLGFHVSSCYLQVEDFYDGAGMVVQPKNFKNSKWLGTNDECFLRP